MHPIEDDIGILASRMLALHRERVHTAIEEEVGRAKTARDWRAVVRWNRVKFHIKSYDVSSDSFSKLA